MPLSCHTGVDATVLLLWVRVAALLFTAVAFSVAVFGASMPPGALTYWCIFSWVFSFTRTLMALLVEKLGLQDLVPVPWPNLQITLALYAALLCASASRIIPLFPVRGPIHEDIHGYRLITKIFSGLATVAFMREISLSKVSTARDLMSVFQTFVACIILILVSETASYDQHVALQWCMAVYCICLIFSTAVVALYVAGHTDSPSTPLSRLLLAYSLLAVIMYATATVLWPMYHSRGTMSVQVIVVTVLTAINFLLYLTHLAFTVKHVFCSAREENR